MPGKPAAIFSSPFLLQIIPLMLGLKSGKRRNIEKFALKFFSKAMDWETKHFPDGSGKFAPHYLTVPLLCITNPVRFSL
jgi:hypothetical protein